MPKIFNASKFEEKLSALTRSKDSIQNISMWIIHHKHYCNEIVNEWLKAFKKGDIPYRLTLFYVANDVLQHCKKKGAPEFREAYANVLEGVMTFASDERIKDEVIRLIDIWNKRSVYNPEFLKKLQDNIEESSVASQRIMDSEENSPDIDLNTIANFRVKDLIFSLRHFVEFQKELQNKCETLLSISDIEIPELSSLPSASYSQAVRLSAQMETLSVPVGNCLEAAEQGIARRQKIIRQLEKSQVFYNLQNVEVEKVVHAYKVFGRKVKRLKKVLNEKMSMLVNADPTGISTSSHSQVQQGSPKMEDPQSSLDKRLLSMFQDSALLGSHSESHDTFSSSSPLQDTRIANCNKDEEMNTERNTGENEYMTALSNDNSQHNSEQVVSNTVDNLIVKEESQSIHESEVNEPMNIDSLEKDVISSLSVSQSSENQASFFNTLSDKNMENLQLEKSTLQNISLPLNSVPINANNDLDNTGDPEPVGKVKAYLIASPLKDDKSLIASPLISSKSVLASPLKDNKSLLASPLKDSKSPLVSPVKGNKSLIGSSLKDDKFCPHKKIVSPNSPNTISVPSDSKEKETSSYQSPHATFQNFEVSKSPLRENFQQTAELQDMNLFKRLHQTNSPTRQLLKSARILNHLLSQSPEHESKPAVLEHSSKQHMMPINSLLKLLFQHPNTSSDKINPCKSSSLDKGKSDLCDKKSDLSMIASINKLQSYLLNIQKDSSAHENLDTRQQSENSGIFNNSEFRNFITSDSHNSKFQPILQLLANKCDESKDLVSKTGTLPVSCKSIEMYSENISPEPGEQPSSEKGDIYDNAETKFIQIAPKGKESDIVPQVGDKNLEIMDMDVDSSDDETMK